MSVTVSTRARTRFVPRLEQLEDRHVLSGVGPTAVEQQFLELLNNARANPAAYGASIGLDLSNLIPAQPLAFDPRLIQAALGHSQDMNDRNYFGHFTPEGVDPGGRMAAAGFSAVNWGESIAAGYPDPATALRALIIDDGIADLGHRRHLLSIDSVYRSQDAVGIGIVLNGSGSYQDYYTIDTAANPDPRPYLTGVVYTDANHNGVYDPGEGLGGVTVTVQGVGSTTTFDSGGYSFQVSPGTYTVTFSGPGLPNPVASVFTIGSTNYRLTVTPGGSSTSTPTPPPTPASTPANPDTAWLGQTYQSLLGRAPGAADYSYWLGQLQQGVSHATVIAQIEASPEYISVGGSKWLQQIYPYLIGRDPGAADYSYWVGLMQQGTSHDAIIAAIMQSPAYRYHDAAQWLPGAYQALLGRAPAPADYAYWVNQLGNGMTHDEAVALIVSSPEYLSKLQDKTVGWIDQVYQSLLHRHAGPADFSYWAGVLQSGTSRTEAALQMMASPEYQVSTSVTWITQLYHDLLLRTPASSDLVFWINALQGGFPPDAVLTDFFDSPEYAARHSAAV